MAVEKKNILIMVAKLGGGGTERVACRLANGLSARHRVYLMYFFHYGHAYEINPEVTVVDCTGGGMVMPDRGLFRKALYLVRKRMVVPGKVWQFKKKHKIDVSISMLRIPNLFNVLIPGGGRRILSERNDPSRKPFWERFSNRICYYLGDHVVFQTHYVQNMFPHFVRRKSTIIANPVEVSCKRKDKTEHVIVNVGRLNPQKNQQMLIHAFYIFHEHHPEYTLQIYGEGKERDNLQNTINSLGLGDAAHLMGFSDDVHKAIRSAEIFVLSSDFEGMPNALMEAMMMGFPCIATSCTGVPELLTDKQDGILVPVGDQAKLAEAMILLAEDPALREHLAEQAAKKASGFGTEEVLRQWESIL